MYLKIHMKSMQTKREILVVNDFFSNHLMRKTVIFYSACILDEKHVYCLIICVSNNVEGIEQDLNKTSYTISYAFY